MFKSKTIALATSLLIGAVTQAQVYDLKEQSFDNPEFKARFIESYVAESDINPNITAEEKGLFDEIVPLIQSDPSAAITRLNETVTSESSAAFDFILGNLLYQEGDEQGAIDAYAAAIKKFPNYYRAYYNLGRVYVASGDYQQALKNLQKSLSMQGGDGTLYGLIGYCYINLDQPSTALDAYRNAIMLAPESRDWKQGKLQCLIALESTDEAIGMLYEFIEMEPANADWWKLQANQFLNASENLKAAANLTVVKDMGKSDAASLTLLGDLLVNEGLFEQALDSYLIALDSPGARPQRIIEVVQSMVYQDELEKAKVLSAKLESKGGDFLNERQELSLLNIKARLALKEDDIDGAADYLNSIVDKDPMNGDALLSLSDLEKDRGDIAKAEYYAETASKLDGYEHRSFISLAQMSVGKRDYASAAKYLRQAQDVDPKDYVADYLLRVEQAALRM